MSLYAIQIVKHVGDVGLSHVLSRRRRGKKMSQIGSIRILRLEHLLIVRHTSYATSSRQ